MPKHVLAMLTATVLASAAAHATTTYSGETLINNKGGLLLDVAPMSTVAGRRFLAAIGTATELLDGASGDLQIIRSSAYPLPKTIFLPLASVTVNDQDDRILEEKFAGTISLRVEADDLTNSGGNLLISNVTLDLAQRIIRADLSSTNGINLGQGNLLDSPVTAALFSVSALKGTTRATGLLDRSVVFIKGEMCACGPIKSLNASSLGLDLGVLSVSPQGQSALTSSLGLIESGQHALSLSSTYFAQGSVRAVPEPSGFALMALGMTALLVARKRLSLD